jgi:hypothetical protein
MPNEVCRHRDMMVVRFVVISTDVQPLLIVHWFQLMLTDRLSLTDRVVLLLSVANQSFPYVATAGFHHQSDYDIDDFIE